MRAKFVSIEVASARGVAERWRVQYEKPHGWSNTATGNSKDIHDKLCALGINPPLDSVAEIIGNKSWSYLLCSGCSDYMDRGVRIKPEYDEGGVFCATCIEEAHQILNGEKS